MDLAHLQRDAGAWAASLGAADIRVLARTCAEIAALRGQGEALTARDVGRVLLHDPMFSLRLLRQVQALRGPGQNADISTVEHALMMLGIEPFFARFADLPTIESRLSGLPDAYRGLLAVLRRSHHAALNARDWAEHRRDTAANEIAVAALLHDLAEMLLWCFAPAAMLRIQAMQQADPALRSSRAQREVLGFSVRELQGQLVKQWRLGDLLRSMMAAGRGDRRSAPDARARTVALAADLARHSARGWDDAALPDDYAALAELLKVKREEALQIVERTARQSMLAWDWYQPAGGSIQDSAGGDDK